MQFSYAITFNNGKKMKRQCKNYPNKNEGN